MDLKALLNDDDAVSPVIGVILMVAITVILAAVIASFVLGLGDTTQTTPTASFSFDYDSSGGSGGDVTITHDGGDPIQVSELYIRGNSDVDTTLDGDDGRWNEEPDGSASGDDSEVVAGDTATVSTSGDAWELRVVYISSEGDTSSTLSSDSGPDA